MILEKEREQVKKIGRKLISSGLTTGTGGNISIYNRDENLIAITPSGMDYYEIKAKNIVVMDMEGNIVEGENKPSSEYEMHKICYEKRKDVFSVVHSHSVFATTIASLNWEIPPFHYLVPLIGDKIPIAKYATFGTLELANETSAGLGEKYKAVLLANHGLLAVGSNIEKAFMIAEITELMAELYYKIKVVGEPKILSEDEIKLLEKKFKSYGQT